MAFKALRPSSSLSFSDKNALYVLSINSEKNEIIVGPKEKLGKTSISIKNINLL